MKNFKPILLATFIFALPAMSFAGSDDITVKSSDKAFSGWTPKEIKYAGNNVPFGHQIILDKSIGEKAPVRIEAGNKIFLRRDLVDSWRGLEELLHPDVLFPAPDNWALYYPTAPHEIDEIKLGQAEVERRGVLYLTWSDAASGGYFDKFSYRVPGKQAEISQGLIARIRSLPDVNIIAPFIFQLLKQNNLIIAQASFE